ncbi:MAG: nucleotidyltransferase family protein [Candidatus Kapaibacterium sp.]
MDSSSLSTLYYKCLISESLQKNNQQRSVDNVCAMNDTIDRKTILAYLQERKEELERDCQISRLGLFGSFAVDQGTEQSDIDIIVEFEPNTANLSEKKARIREMLEEEFHRDIDICREKFIKPYFRTHILQTAIYV